MRTIKQLLVTVAMLLCSVTASAYDFEVDGIYYNIISTSDLTVMVTGGDSKYSGAVIIPSTVAYKANVFTVKEIRKFAFSGCSALTSITIPNSITSVGVSAFDDCTSLKTLRFEDGAKTLNLAYKQSDNPYLNHRGLFYDCPLDTLYLGRNISYTANEYYGYSPFYFSPLKSITISDSVTSIRKYAFYNCNNLTSVTIPSSVTGIGEGAFEYCVNLKIVINYSNLTISKGSTSYGYVARYANKVFTDFVDLDGYYVFGVVDGVNTLLGYSGNETEPMLPVNYKGENYVIDAEAFKNNTSITRVTIPNCVTSIGEEVFSNCSTLTSIVIPNSVTSIGSNAFNGCSGLKKVELNCTTISDWFSSIPSIEEVTIGNCVTSIGDKAFFGCSGLESIYLMTTTPPHVSNNNFTDKHYINTVLYVQHGLLATYQDAITWKNFGNIEEFYIDKYFHIRYFVDNVLFETDSIKHGEEIKLLDEPTKEGYTFSGWSEAPATMPAENVVIKGTFAVNYYALTYKVDGNVYATDSIAYGGEIILREAPTKEGYTFSGWSEAPATMPSEDIIIYGSYKVNNYKLIYIIDNAVYSTSDVKYGSTIEPIDEPQKEGHSFNGWVGLPNTMPAEDVVVIGTFSVNSYTVTFMIDGEIYETATVEYGTEIEVPTVPEKEGYAFSGWINVPETMPANEIVVEGSYIANTAIGQIYLDLEKNEVYNLKGLRITETEKFTRGIYVVNGKKIFVK